MTAAAPSNHGVVELRRYAMQPGRREEFLALFEREFIESQEECGMLPVGQYRDLDDADAVAWFRGFADMPARKAALEAFYLQSPVWLENRDAANATLVDSDNVLLLRPARRESGFDLRGLQRGTGAEQERAQSLLGLAVFMLRRPATSALIDTFERETLPQLQTCATRVAYFVTDETPNDFPRLPVREGEFSFVASGVCASEHDLRRWEDALNSMKRLNELQELIVSCEQLRLQPAPRALLR